MSNHPDLSLSLAQKALRSGDPAAIAVALELMEQMSAPALKALSPLIFDLVRIENEATAVMVLDRMLALRPRWVDEKTANHETVLMTAIWFNKPALATSLLDAGADTSAKGLSGFGVLDLAATTKGQDRDKTGIGNVLLTKVEFTQQEKDQALIKAASSGCLAMTRCLLAHGARFGAVTHGATALAAACSPNEQLYRCAEVVREMMATEGALAVIDQGWSEQPSATPLHFAAYAGNLQVLSLLLDAGAAVNLPQDLPLINPDTPLMAAALGMHPVVVDLLIRKGANAAAIDDNAANALHYLARAEPDMDAPGNGVRCLDLLLRAGTDLSLADAHGQSPLDIARALGRHALVAAMEAAVSCSRMDAMTPPPIDRRPPATPRF